MVAATKHDGADFEEEVYFQQNKELSLRLNVLEQEFET